MTVIKLLSTINKAIENGEKIHILGNALWRFFCISRENYLVKGIENSPQDYCVQGQDGYWRKGKLLARRGVLEKSSLLPKRIASP